MHQEYSQLLEIYYRLLHWKLWFTRRASVEVRPVWRFIYKKSRIYESKNKKLWKSLFRHFFWKSWQIWKQTESCARIFKWSHEIGKPVTCSVNFDFVLHSYIGNETIWDITKQNVSVFLAKPHNFVNSNIHKASILKLHKFIISWLKSNLITSCTRFRIIQYP